MIQPAMEELTFIGWYAHYCQNWVDTFLGASNFKHADCNGDGIINAGDTTAIVLNYGEIHLRSYQSPTWRSGLPALNVTMAPDTSYDSSTVVATISFGGFKHSCQ